MEQFVGFISKQKTNDWMGEGMKKESLGPELLNFQQTALHIWKDLNYQEIKMFSYTIW